MRTYVSSARQATITPILVNDSAPLPALLVHLMINMEVDLVQTVESVSKSITAQVLD